MELLVNRDFRIRLVAKARHEKYRLGGVVVLGFFWFFGNPGNN